MLKSGIELISSRVKWELFPDMRVATQRQQVSYSKGFSLVEIMVALLLFSIGLISLNAIQYKALNSTKESLYVSLMASQLISFQERMRANLSMTAKQREMTLWQVQLETLLPGALIRWNSFKPSICWQNDCVY